MKAISTDSINELQQLVVKYRDKRDWRQYHSLKNLASAMSIETAELLEHFLWTEEPRWPEKLEEEVADIFYSLLLFCYEAKIDLGEAFVSKLEKNKAKYPISKSKGSAKKYSDFN